MIYWCIFVDGDDGGAILADIVLCFDFVVAAAAIVLCYFYFVCGVFYHLIHGYLSIINSNYRQW